MSAVDPADAIQAGIFALLDAGLNVGVYDGPPEDVDPDYVTIGPMLSSPDGTHDGEGRQTVAVIDTWTKAESFKSANDIGAAIVALLWHRAVELDAVVAGHTVWRVEHEFSQTLVDPQPGIRHRVDHFRIWSSQA